MKYCKQKKLPSIFLEFGAHVNFFLKVYYIVFKNFIFKFA